MIILDTNVISEAMRGRNADPQVIDWIRQTASQAVTTVINRAEILAGLALLPGGRRLDDLRARATGAFDQLGVCLPLTAECTDHYAEIVSARVRMGRPVGSMDALIGAIARVADASIATRNVDDFADIGVSVINPWEER